MKKLGLFIILLVMPFSVLAYSDKVILGGQTLGIDIKSDGVMVVGFYKVNGKYNKGTTEMKTGDYIYEINGETVDNINDLTNIISANADDEKVLIAFRRGEKEYETTLNLVFEDDIYKTGLYVKDSIIGIGSLTYIDPNTKIYGALGHEIIESSSNSIVEIKSGTIFQNYITSIDKSTTGEPGSKNAKFNYDNKYGTIFSNTKYGIYGIYEDSIDDGVLIDVATSDEIKIGEAIIYTVLDGEKIEMFDIDITAINETSDIKNISFTITDQDLLEETGGVVQGMSGSPIVQNDKIIGAVTHVIVDNPVTGYGLFITTMLEEGEN